jgi:lipopolysaccharide biosynthesis glycosyltransferase
MACDESYAVPLATSIRSIVASSNGQQQIEIVVLTPSRFSAAVKKKVADSVPERFSLIRWVEIDVSQFACFSTAPYISSMTYARLLIPYLLPDYASRALYLDADILVLQDLEVLWQFQMEEAVLAAVNDVASETHAARLNSELRDGFGPHYFNAGVLLIDLPRWRKERISERALEYLKQNPETHLSDQDALNVVCREKWEKLDEKWNYQPSPEEQTSHQLTQDAAIVHFVGPFKPWDPRSRNVHARLYDSFRRRTAFARTRFEVVRDAVIAFWSGSKHSLRQYKAMRVLWRFALGREPRGVIYAPITPRARTIEKV